MSAELIERKHLLVKRGLYYAPDRQGYTGIKDRAGRYREVDALGLDGVTAIHEDDAPMFAPKCFEDIKVKYLTDLITTQAAEIAELRAKLEARNDLPTIAYLAGSADAQDAVAGKIADWLALRHNDWRTVAQAIRDGEWRQG